MIAVISPGNSIEELNHYLYGLAQNRRLASEDVEQIALLLYNKWYSVQVLAAKVLSKFHPPQAADLLKGWLQHHASHRQMCFEAQKALIPCISAADLDWILNLYLEKRDWYMTFLMSALACFPREDVIERLVLDCRQKDNAKSIVVLAGVPFPGREQVLQRLLADPNVPHKQLIQRAFGWGTPSKDKLLKFKKPL